MFGYPMFYEAAAIAEANEKNAAKELEKAQGN